MYHLLRKIKPYLKEPILDIGAGKKLWWLRRLIEWYPDYDIIDQKLNYTWEEYEPTRKYNTILMIKVLEHVDDPLTFIQKAYDCLEYGGHLIIVIPNCYSQHRTLAEKMGLIRDAQELNEWDIAQGHKHNWHDVMFSDLLNQFVDDDYYKVFEVGYKPLTNRQMELIPYKVLKTWVSNYHIIQGAVLLGIIRKPVKKID